MKSSIALLLGMTLIAGCGQPGPLYMPKPPAKPAPAASAAPSPSSPAAQQ